VLRSASNIVMGPTRQQSNLEPFTQTVTLNVTRYAKADYFDKKLKAEILVPTGRLALEVNVV